MVKKNFINSKNITKITFGESIDMNIIFKMNKMLSLKEIVFGNDYHFKGNKLFRINNGTLSSIHLKPYITKINGNVIQYTQLTSYTIPTNVTKLNNNCFIKCRQLTEIKGLEQIKEFEKGCFFGCNKLNLDQYPQLKEMKEYLFSQPK